mgnify:CR=1 FL=1
MFGESVFNAALSDQKVAKVKALGVNEGSKSTISNIDITSKVDIALNAAMSLYKVDFT